MSLDLRRNEPSPYLSAGTFLSFFATNTPGPHAGRMLEIFEQWTKKVRYTVPSFDPTHELFDSIRYWRGPVWAIINWMIANGLQRNGYLELAARIHRDTRALICDVGFYEYFCPLTGKGGGGDAFSWTAAMWLAWASPSAQGTMNTATPAPVEMDTKNEEQAGWAG